MTYYNRKRRRSALAYINPVEFRKKNSA
ncbi:hypothetical protein [Leptospira noguchii]